MLVLRINEEKKKKNWPLFISCTQVFFKLNKLNLFIHHHHLLVFYFLIKNISWMDKQSFLKLLFFVLLSDLILIKSIVILISISIWNLNKIKKKKKNFVFDSCFGPFEFRIKMIIINYFLFSCLYNQCNYNL